MKILHTSDWHLGRPLYGRKRYDEFATFLEWLSALIEQQGIDILLVAGDIFDNSTPSNRAQELYYRFLRRTADSCCRHVVIIAGNHDSPTFLDAPKELLLVLNVHVIGAMCENPEDEVLVLSNDEGRPEAIVCAVPYLHDRDIRTVEAGETVADKNTKLLAGVHDHYQAVCDIALQKRQGLPDVPIIAMGHLFTAGGRTVEGDGVRELYIGSLAHVGADAFPASIDYLALGHLHIPQQVGAALHRRYSGSPIPMGYGEAYQDKKVVLATFTGSAPVIEEHAVPCFQPLERLSGTLDEVLSRISGLKRCDSNAWLEIEYTGSERVANLREQIDDSLAGSRMECQRIKNRQVMERALSQTSEEEILDDLRVDDVFLRCLDSYAVAPDERPELIRAHCEIVQSLAEEDSQAE